MINFHFDWNLSSSCKATIVIFIILATLFIILGIRFSKLDPEKDEVPTKGIMGLAVMLVIWANNLAVSNINKEEKKFFGPFVVTSASFLTFANLASLLGLVPPMSNLAVALSMSLIAFIILEVFSFKYQGVKGKIDGLLGPVKGVSFLVLPISIISEFTTPIAMGMRLFGNIFSGVVLGALVLGACEGFGVWVGSITATLFTAILVHTVFDVAFGLIQMFVYTMLTLMLSKQNMGIE
ncbi:MAG: F0F1 ATP synthase subunit A [Gammaproteobacteria bacterium]|nr:F0F1 ATP synthase subunit A [Gammaproteobacteria bacterium]